MSRYVDTDVLKEQMLKYGFHSADQTVSEFVEDILPTADVVEVVHGENISKDGFLCSICKFGDFGGFHGYEPNYCPNCGARMEGEEE